MYAWWKRTFLHLSPFDSSRYHVGKRVYSIIIIICRYALVYYTTGLTGRPCRPFHACLEVRVCTHTNIQFMCTYILLYGLLRNGKSFSFCDRVFFFSFLVFFFISSHIFRVRSRGNNTTTIRRCLCVLQYIVCLTMR